MKRYLGKQIVLISLGQFASQMRITVKADLCFIKSKNLILAQLKGFVKDLLGLQFNPMWETTLLDSGNNKVLYTSNVVQHKAEKALKVLHCTEEPLCFFSCDGEQLVENSWLCIAEVRFLHGTCLYKWM